MKEKIADLVSKFLIDDEFILDILHILRMEVEACDKCKVFVNESKLMDEVLEKSECVKCGKRFKLLKRKVAELVDLKGSTIATAAEIFKSIIKASDVFYKDDKDNFEVKK